MSITTVGNHLIHYEVLGRGRGQPIIFIHGWLGSWRYWWKSMQGLSAQHRTFALDLWGFGDSSKAADAYTLEDYVEMLSQFIEQLGIVQPVTLVGHSLGAVVALKYACAFPKNVDRLVTVALPLKGSDVDGRLTDMDVTSYVTRFIGKNRFSEVDNELRKTDQTAVQKLTREIAAEDFHADLLKCGCPVLAIHGKQDMVVKSSVETNNHQNDAANLRFYVGMDGCTHFPMLEEAAKFNRLILEFIHADDTITELTPKDYWQRRVR